MDKRPQDPDPHAQQHGIPIPRLRTRHRGPLLGSRHRDPRSSRYPRDRRAQRNIIRVRIAARSEPEASGVHYEPEQGGELPVRAYG